MKRTPVNFPRMKVRGWRRREKLAARIVQAVDMHARAVRHGDGTAEFAIVPAAEATHTMRFSMTFDGFGRRVA